MRRPSTATDHAVGAKLRAHSRPGEIGCIGTNGRRTSFAALATLGCRPSPYRVQALMCRVHEEKHTAERDDHWRADVPNFAPTNGALRQPYADPHIGIALGVEEFCRQWMGVSLVPTDTASLISGFPEVSPTSFAIVSVSSEVSDVSSCLAGVSRVIRGAS